MYSRWFKYIFIEIFSIPQSSVGVVSFRSSQPCQCFKQIKDAASFTWKQLYNRSRSKATGEQERRSSALDNLARHLFQGIMLLRSRWHGFNEVLEQPLLGPRSSTTPPVLCPDPIALRVPLLSCCLSLMLRGKACISFPFQTGAHVSELSLSTLKEYRWALGASSLAFGHRNTQLRSSQNDRSSRRAVGCTFPLSHYKCDWGRARRWACCNMDRAPGS